VSEELVVFPASRIILSLPREEQKGPDVALLNTPAERRERTRGTVSEASSSDNFMRGRLSPRRLMAGKGWLGPATNGEEAE